MTTLEQKVAAVVDAVADYVGDMIHDSKASASETGDFSTSYSKEKLGKALLGLMKEEIDADEHA